MLMVGVLPIFIIRGPSSRYQVLQFLVPLAHQRFKWPIIAAALSAAVGLGMMFKVRELSLWSSLILMSVPITGSYYLCLYLAERETLYEYGYYFLKPMWIRVRRKRKKY